MTPIILLGLMYFSAGCQTAGVSVADSTDRTPRAEPATVYEPVSVDSRAGVLVMAHGGDETWNRAVEQVVAPLRESYPVEIAFGMARTSTMRAAVERLERRGVDRIAVVRMFISGESFRENTEYILGLRRDAGDAVRHGMHRAHNPAEVGADSEALRHAPGGGTMNPGKGHAMEPPTPIESDATFVLSEKGVAASPLIDDILLDRVRSLSLDPASESVLILAHGPGDDGENERWLADMRRRAERLRTIGPFRDIRCETLREDWLPRRVEAEKRIREYVQTRSDGEHRVIVVPFRVAGFGPYRDVLGELEYVADGLGFCPHPNMTAWIDRAARECLPSLPAVRFETRAASRAD